MRLSIEESAREGFFATADDRKLVERLKKLLDDIERKEK